MTSPSADSTTPGNPPGSTDNTSADTGRSVSDLRSGPLDSRTVISFYHVSLRYGGGFHALRDVQFQVDNGEFLFIVGPSGAGKSSILRLITMDELPTDGQVVVGPYVSTRIKRRQIPLMRREIGMVFQDFRLLEDRNVQENIAFAQMVIGVPSAETKKNVTRVLNWVGLYHKRNQSVRTLSGGERQRVAIARAIVNSPKILLADEPTGNLDPEVSQDIIELLFRINASGTAVMMSTHDHIMVRQYGQRIIALEGGAIVSDVERYRPSAPRREEAMAERKLVKHLDDARQIERERWESGVLQPTDSGRSGEDS